jgi:deoxycytidine triphosphate deaminase
MAYLSNRDFYNEFGKNLLIYPFIGDNIKGASINLTASEYAWDINTKKHLSKITLSDGSEKLIAPPFATVAIQTQEVIYVGDNICGTYHSKVGMTIKGFSNISTTLDPEYIGTSLICLNNNTPVQQELVIGKTFVTLMFSYLSQSALDGMIKKPNTPGQRERINLFEESTSFFEKQRNEEYHDNKDKLKAIMTEDEAFKKWRAEFSKKDKHLVNKQFAEENKKNKSVICAKVILYILALVLILLVIVGLIYVIEINSYDYLKSYISLIVLVLAFVVNECLKKSMAYIEEKIEERYKKNGK